MAAAADLKLNVYLLDMAVEEARAETAALMR